MNDASDIRLVALCGACPESYEAFDPEGNQVGDLYLRNGFFRVDAIDPEGNKTRVLEAYPEGDGLFEYEERDAYLTAAKKAILRNLQPRAFAIPDALGIAAEDLDALLDGLSATCDILKMPAESGIRACIASAREILPVANPSAPAAQLPATLLLELLHYRAQLKEFTALSSI